MKGSVALCISKLRLRALTARILAAYLSKNRYAALNLKDLEESIYGALADCARTDNAPPRSGSDAVPASRRTPRGKSTFRQRDIRAAISAAEKAGKEVSGVEIDHNGTIKIVVGKLTQQVGANEWDEVLK